MRRLIQVSSHNAFLLWWYNKNAVGIMIIVMFYFQDGAAVSSLVEIKVSCSNCGVPIENIELDPIWVSKIVGGQERSWYLLHFSEGMRSHQRRHCNTTEIIDSRQKYIPLSLDHRWASILFFYCNQVHKYLGSLRGSEMEIIFLYLFKFISKSFHENSVGWLIT